MPIDPSIALQGQVPQAPDMLGKYGKAMTLQHLMLQNNALQQKAEDDLAMSEVYRGAVNPDGTINRQAVLAGAASRGQGRHIPGMVKGFNEQDKAAGDIRHTTAQTREIDQKVLYTGLKHIDEATVGLLSDPDLNDEKVVRRFANLVGRGAFDAQAAASNMRPDQFAFKILETMPRNNPAALRQWVQEAAIRTADQKQRLELVLPKFDEQDRGGTINEGTVNMMTGQRTPLKDVPKTATPDALVKAAVDNTAVIEDSSGNAHLVGKTGPNAGVSTPVVQRGSNLPLEMKGAPAAAHRKLVQNITGGIGIARELIKGGPTASGAGALIDKMLAFTGTSTKGGDLASSLKTLSGWLTANVPRMEGPQSNMDVITYQQMAAAVGDETMPIDRRISALNTLEDLVKKYSLGAGPSVPPQPRNAGGKPAPVVPGGSGNTAVDINSFFLKK